MRRKQANADITNIDTGRGKGRADRGRKDETNIQDDNKEQRRGKAQISVWTRGDEHNHLSYTAAPTGVRVRGQGEGPGGRETDADTEQI